MKFENIVLCLLLLVGLAATQDVNVTNVTEENATFDMNATNVSAAVNSAAVQARYENVRYGYEKTIAAMGIVIDYFEERLRDTAQLKALKDNFTTLFDGLQQYVDANDPSGFGKQVAAMHQIAAQFKRETASLAELGEMGDLTNLVRAQVRAKEESVEMKKVKERAMEKLKRAYNLSCGLNLGRLRYFIANLTAQNFSAEGLDALRERIRERCENLSQARNETQLRERAAALRDELNDANARMITYARIANERAIERATAVVNALENRGVNVSAVKEKLQIVEQAKTEAMVACANISSDETREACKAKIGALKDEATSIGEQIRIIAKDNVTRKVSKSRGGAKGS